VQVYVLRLWPHLASGRRICQYATPSLLVLHVLSQKPSRLSRARKRPELDPRSASRLQRDAATMPT